MNSATLVLPQEIMLRISEDRATSCDSDPVRILKESADAGSLVIRWNDSVIELLAENGGVSFQRNGVERFYLNRRRQIEGWWLIELGVMLADSGLMVLYTDRKHERVFNAFLENLESACTPISPLIEEKDILDQK